MPGLVSLRVPSDAHPLNIVIPNQEPNLHHQNPKSYSPIPRRTPSPSASRTKSSPDAFSAGRRADHLKLDDSSLDNPDLGPFLLKVARDTIASGLSPLKALDYAIRASLSFERSAQNGELGLEFAMSLHVVAAVYCSLGRFQEAVPVLERAIKVTDVKDGKEHALAAFAGHMQLGDTHSMLGQLDRSIACYEAGLKIQIETLGDMDPRIAETCRYLAEAHVQATQFHEAEELCQKILDVHREHSPPASVQEAADRRFMALICEAKGEYELALEHLILASMAMIANSQDQEVAAIDVSVGDIYVSLARFDEAIFSYQKALTVFKSMRGDNHSSVASIFVRLADLYYKIGKFRESKSYCDSAVRVFTKPMPGVMREEIVAGLTDVSAIYEAMNEREEAVKLLQRAIEILEDIPGQRGAILGLEAQIGVMLYMVGRYADSRNFFESALLKLRAAGDKSSAFLRVVLNQMGLACLQLYEIDEAAELFKEAKTVNQEYGPPCLDVDSNLAGTFDAMGRVDAAIELLEHILKVREEKLGTAHPDADDEKKRLSELLKEAGRARSNKNKSLENLLNTGAQVIKKEGMKKWGVFNIKS